jgi:hypothetical protein
MKNFLILICFIITTNSFSQNVGIGTTTPNSSAILELNSNSKAFMPPRMNFGEIKNISSPQPGMMVYDTEFRCMRVYNGVQWVALDISPTVAPGSFRLTETGSGSSEYVSDVEADPLSGNVYVTGILLSGNMDGETALGGNDIFVTAYNSIGTRLWTRIAGNALTNVSNGIAVDNLGNVYICGHTQGVLDGQPNAGDYDAIIIKYNSAGVKQWARLLGSAGTELCLGIVTDPTGNVYITGATNSTLSGQINNGLNDMFVAKYTISGDFVWTRLAGSIVNDYGNAIVTDGLNLYIAGEADATMDGQIFAGGSRDILFMKYDLNGNKIFTRLNGTTGNEAGQGIDLDFSGDLLISGSTSGNLNGQANNGSDDVFIIKYNNGGTLSSTKLFGGTGFDVAMDIAADAAGNIYLTGHTASPSFMGQTGAGNYDVFLMKITGAYNSVFTKLGGGSNADFSFCISKIINNTVYIGGYISGPTTATFHNTTYTTSFSLDGFLWKYGE